VPFGILNTQTDQRSLDWGQSAETRAFMVDCLAAWWTDNQPSDRHLHEWVIDLDGGPANRADRTQFIKRIVERSHTMGLTIRLLDDPPDYSQDKS